MEIGLIFALLVAVVFGANSVFLRRGLLKAGESYSAVVITLFIGVLLFLLMITFTMQWDKVWSLSGQLIALLQDRHPHFSSFGDYYFKRTLYYPPRPGCFVHYCRGNIS